MFVTCFMAVLDPQTGHLCYANAGHDVPYHVTANGVKELRATGMPLGLMPGMAYEEKETMLAADDYFLLYSDGLVEAHAPDREMFGFPRLQDIIGRPPRRRRSEPIPARPAGDFTGPDWEQEDDVTLVTIQRLPHAARERLAAPWRELASFEVAQRARQ